MNELKRLQLRIEDDISYPEDVDKIVEDFKQHGYEISRSDARTAWKEYSDGYSAGWMNGVQNGDTFNILKQHFIEEE
jgi:N-acetyl-anhydromuramyl-L-alanine amidase AmpD